MPQKSVNNKTLPEWLTHLEHIHPNTIELGLERMRPVAQRIWLKSPCPIVTIGGTNGKGTTVAALQTLASQQGWRVGVYTSPHLLSFNERIVIDSGEAYPVNDEWLISAFEAIEHLRGDVMLTYFEYTTLAALWIFQQSSLDLVILEVGLGGRLDSTNVIDADLSIITRIAMDHMEHLGDTREKIAIEKAGIMRKEKACLYGGDDLQIFMKHLAQEHGALLQCYEQDFYADDEIHRASHETHIPVANLACAKQAFLLLGGEEKPGMWKRLADKKPLGRFMRTEWKGKPVIFDVAHNPDSMSLLASHLKDLPNQDIRVVVGMLSDKDHQASLAVLKTDPRISFYVSSPAGTPRGAPAAILMEALREARAYPFESLTGAFQASLTDSSSDTIYVIVGSFWTVSEVYNALASL